MSRTLRRIFVGLLAALAVLTLNAQVPRAPRLEAAPEEASRQTMKQLVRGTNYAAASMAPQATLTAEHVLAAGGNAFDAIVAGQAVLGIVQPAMNGLGSDAQLLVYDATQRKVFSVNAEGTAPKLATIEWYKTNQAGRLPSSDSLLAGTVPGVVDAWYVLLSRWGTKSFGELLAPAIELAERGVSLGRMLNSRGLAKYPSSVRLYAPTGKIWKDGELFKNRTLGRTLRRLVESEKEAAPKGRLAALKAARDRFYKGHIALDMPQFSAQNDGLFHYAHFSNYSSELDN